MDINTIIPNREKALLLAKKALPEFVYNAVNLEGIHYTLPEVQTLLDGVTVGGHRLSDQTITLNQAAAWYMLFEHIERRTFCLNKAFVCELHTIAAESEALEWGKFRHSSVTIVGTEYLPPLAEELDILWEKMLSNLNTISDIYDRAITLFLTMARTQFFYDVNKRMGRFLMNGLLLDAGYPAINLPAKKQLEFNTLMLDFYESGNTQPMIGFMKSCLSPQIIEIMSSSN